MSMNQDDETLVQQMQQGDIQALGELYTRHKNEIYRAACLITGSCADGEDLTQETFLTCAQSIQGLRDGSKFRPWLFQILNRSAWKYCRKRAREQPSGDDMPERSSGESTLDAVLRDETQRQLYAALHALDAKQRTVIVLYYFNDLSVKEISQATGTREGTVKSRLYSARRRLRQALTTPNSHTKEAISHEQPEF